MASSVVGKVGFAVGAFLLGVGSGATAIYWREPKYMVRIAARYNAIVLFELDYGYVFEY